jgi:hypothetical protein
VHEWHRDPTFWRDVYTRALAGVIIALLAFLAAVAGGYVRVHTQGVITAVLIVGGALLSNVMFDRRVARLEARGVTRWSGRYWLLSLRDMAIAFVIILAVAGVVVLIRHLAG